MTSPSADVIFVVEEKQCNADIASKLQLVATDIDEALSAALMTGNRFAVVTFGGSGIHADAQLHTVSGQVFLDSADVSKVEDSMEILDESARRATHLLLCKWRPSCRCEQVLPRVSF